DASLTAGTLDATMRANEEGQARVEKAELGGGVTLDGRDSDGLRIRAEARQITAWPQRDRAILLGDAETPASVRRDQTSIEAGQLELDGRIGLVDAFGAGRLEHEIQDPDRDKRGRLTARWSQQMLLNDETGDAALHGEVVTRIVRKHEEDKIEAESVTIRFTPRDEAVEGASPGIALETGAEAASGRQFLGAIAIGEVLGGSGDGLAQVRSGRWVADATAEGGRRLVSLLSLEGPRIDADAVEGTLDVPGAGRLVMLDHRASDEEADEGAAGAQDEQVSAAAEAAGPDPLQPEQMAHGETLITWQGAMEMRRASGRLDIDRAVRLSHRPNPDDPLVNLDCERLEARMRETGAGAGGPGDQFAGELISAEAFGAVWAQSGQRELVADRLTYDAITRDIEATAPGSIVVLFDGARGATATASRILWNIATDHIRIEEPGSVTAPAPQRPGREGGGG
ncbi:MAG: hypothetical protein ACF8R7_11540, partial [Phycisphaerales bacterium JB039]